MRKFFKSKFFKENEVAPSEFLTQLHSFFKTSPILKAFRDSIEVEDVHLAGIMISPSQFRAC
jgi:hypothetical protein